MASPPLTQSSSTSSLPPIHGPMDSPHLNQNHSQNKTQNHSQNDSVDVMAPLSPAKVILVFVRACASADIDRLAYLVHLHPEILRGDLVLSLVLTYLPEATPPARYVPFLQSVQGYEPPVEEPVDLDLARWKDLGEEEAIAQVRQLPLRPVLPLEEEDDDAATWRELLTSLPAAQTSSTATAPSTAAPPSQFAAFLLHRSHRIDAETGLLNHVLDLVTPFLPYFPPLRTWLFSTVLPLYRRNCEYYPQAPPVSHRLEAFRQLPPGRAVELLLSHSHKDTIVRDLRGLIAPYLLSDPGYDNRTGEGQPVSEDHNPDLAAHEPVCAGLEATLQWLLAQASLHWDVFFAAVDGWSGPLDVDLSPWKADASYPPTVYANSDLPTGYADDQGDPEHPQKKLRAYFAQRLQRATSACIYTLPSLHQIDRLSQAYRLLVKLAAPLEFLPHDLPTAAVALAPIEVPESLMSPRGSALLRGNLLDPAHELTHLTSTSISLQGTLLVSAFLLYHTSSTPSSTSSSSSSLKRLCDLAFIELADHQKAEATRYLSLLSSPASRHKSDAWWEAAHRRLLWLHSWGHEDRPCGPFGRVSREYLESHFLKHLLTHGQLTLARSLYDDDSSSPSYLSDKALEEVVVSAVFATFDTAANPNRHQGNLKKCRETLLNFPTRLPVADRPRLRRIEHLLQATHALGEYRLVLRQGEPFRPVMLRIHADPIALLAKVLEQNPKSYTQCQELTAVAVSMVEAGSYRPTSEVQAADRPKQQQQQQQVPEDKIESLARAKRRVLAMCIDAALREGDFETAYSYVVSRIPSLAERSSVASPSLLTSSGWTQGSQPGPEVTGPSDAWLWKAALQASECSTYAHARDAVRSSVQANPLLRHLEQRIDCYATALRIAPADKLPTILDSFHDCEAALEAALEAEAASEAEWAHGRQLATSIPGSLDVFDDDDGDRRSQRSSFDGPRLPQTVITSQPYRGLKATTPTDGRGHATAAPLSLFDLSRATAEAASKNLRALSGLNKAIPFASPGTVDAAADPSSRGPDPLQSMVRKRDQLRDAAVGTLVSGVGWLLNAPAPPKTEQDE